MLLSVVVLPTPFRPSRQTAPATGTLNVSSVKIWLSP
jgi:hypothetical protein